MFRAGTAQAPAILRNHPASIEHIGSTAVPGLVAKPSIDILVGLRHYAEVEWAIRDLMAAGYHYDAHKNAPLVGRQWLFRHRSGHRTHHIHLVSHGSPEWEDRVRFRNLLRDDPQLRLRYATLKRALAHRYIHARARYSAAKGTFIRSALDHGGSRAQPLPSQDA
ncbi:MAG: GrpB family protein [Burkholderiaceae bacterium]